MQTLYEFGMEVQKIREAIDSVEIKGQRNASLIVYAFEKCNDIIKAINEVIEQQNSPADGQNGEESFETGDDIETEEDELNGEPNSGTA